MNRKYNDPRDIPDEAIKEAFRNCDHISFSAKNFNWIRYRYVGISDLGWWLPLTRVLPLIGITPQMLRPVFNPQKTTVKRPFPFNLYWFGLNKLTIKMVEMELPKMIESYDQLGAIPLDPQLFVALAKVLGKPIKVFLDDVSSGHHDYWFTAYLDRVVEETESGF